MNSSFGQMKFRNFLGSRLMENGEFLDDCARVYKHFDMTVAQL